MELGFIAAAMKRYLAMVAACAIVGVVLGVLAVRSAEEVYEARAVMLVLPPSDGNGSTFNGDPDRYVDAEISTMYSRTIQDMVVAKVPGETAFSASQAVRFEQRPNSDVVDVVATTPSPVRSRDLANAYAESYIAYTQQVAADASQPSTELEQLNVELAALETTLAELTAKIRDALPAGATDISESTDTVSLAKRDATLLEYQRLLDTKTRLENQAEVTVNSEIVDLSGVPTTPTGGGSKLLLALGLIGGLGVGASMALLRARFSSEVIDPAQVQELLGKPITVHIPRVRGLGLDTTRLATSPPDEIVEPIERLCVGAQSAATGDCVRIAVTGTVRAVGSSSLSAAMAGRFARRGSPTMLVDADQVDPWVSEVFGTVRGRGLIRLLTSSGMVAADKSSGPAATVGSMSIGTKIPELRVLGIGEVDVEHPLQRVDIPKMIAMLSVPGTVSIIDAGPMLDNAASLEIARLVDAVVVLMPEHRQQTWQLATIERSLADSHVAIFPVVSGTRSRRRLTELLRLQPKASA
ncbi:MAG: hypothetical protein ABMA25_09135 [Ilumatobacteraceae bacterium]